LASEGDEVTIGCYTSGDEPIRYTWTKGGSPIVDSSVVKLNGVVLIVRLKSDKDFRTYVCTATNSERTVIYRINRVEFKKYTTAVKSDTNKNKQSQAKEGNRIIKYHWIIFAMSRIHRIDIKKNEHSL
jgi:trimethylamine:corrinoid methyltransferase-like protein